jgi:hypothetical protein
MARLVTAQFDFIPNGPGLKVCKPKSDVPLAWIEPDARWPGMWRVRRLDGTLSGMVNLARARDAAYGAAEVAVFTRSEPA